MVKGGGLAGDSASECDGMRTRGKRYYAKLATGVLPRVMLIGQVVVVARLEHGYEYRQDISLRRTPVILWYT